MLFHAAELTELRFDDDALRVGRVDNALGDFNVLLVRLGARVDHDGAVEAAGDAVHAGGLVAVIEMHGEDRIREDLVGGLDHGLEHLLVRVRAGALRKLDDERRLAVHVALEETHGLFQVVDVGAPTAYLLYACEQFLAVTIMFQCPLVWS